MCAREKEKCRAGYKGLGVCGAGFRDSGNFLLQTSGMIKVLPRGWIKSAVSSTSQNSPGRQAEAGPSPGMPTLLGVFPVLPVLLRLILVSPGSTPLTSHLHTSLSCRVCFQESDLRHCPNLVPTTAKHRFSPSSLAIPIALSELPSE